MRFLNFSEYFPPHMGSDKRIFDFNNEFHSQGIEIIFILPPPMRELLEEDLRKRNIEKRTNIGGMLGFHVKMPSLALKLGRKNPLFSLPLLIVKFLFFSIRKMKKIKPDLVILNLSSHFPALLGLIVGKMFRKQVICDVPDLITEYVAETFKLPFKRVVIHALSIIEIFVLKHTNHNIACTRFIADYFIRKGIDPNRFSVVYTGIHQDLFKVQEENQFPKNGKVFEVDYAGRIDDWTGLDILLDAAEKLKENGINACFNLFGHGNAKDRLEKDVAARGLQEYCLFHGYLPHDRILQRYTETDIAMCLFRASLLTHAAMPVKLFEYLSMGLPVIASNLKGIKEIVTDGKNAFLLPRHSGDAMYETLCKIIKNKEKTRDIALAGRALVEHKFNWPELADEYISVIKKRV
nr:glycosyltransferase family 4 protein [Candidatus Sigynarchaeota archaeon]